MRESVAQQPKLLIRWQLRNLVGGQRPVEVGRGGWRTAAGRASTSTSPAAAGCRSDGVAAGCVEPGGGRVVSARRAWRRGERG
ncbi:hypothetical protein, partial [Mycobacterium avium]|uniref:hypothetical protein n=1 Tax=Mycobacterium avium TaxID=1764 RepID=UPI001F3A8CA5